MAAAVSAKEHGIEEVMLLERRPYLGGVLPQCIHNGFGTQIYEKDYTGGEYAFLWEEKTKEAGIEVFTNTTVLSIEKGWEVKYVSASEGARIMKADAVIVATGCRERTLPQMLIPGSRPAGVFTAGAAQLMMNLKNYLPGKSAVILGSGDIGLIMARRMTLEGIKVKMILGQEATGLARNIVQCVEDFHIPMRYGWTVASTHGYERLKGVSIAPFKEDGGLDLKRKEYIPCDTLLVATGLISELEVCGSLVPGREDGLFVCGNAHMVHDLVDHVTIEAVAVGRQVAKYLGVEIGCEDELDCQQEELTGRKGNMICTICPKSCLMQVDKSPFSVTGNQCDKGEAFARQEIESPKRVLTTVVKTSDTAYPVLSVRTDRVVKKKELFTIMKAVKKLYVKGPVMIGQVIAEDIAGTGANLIATWQIPK